MKKILMAVVTMAAVMPASAQETYEIANIGTQDLNGTARYVGMGGAMEALGADISTMQSNPAGVGLFRKSQIQGSFGLVSQGGESSFASANKTNVSFDQIGFVYSGRTGKTSYLNVGFNYHKSRNFDQILTVADRLDGASQSRLTLDKFKAGVITNSRDLTYSQADVLYHEGLYYSEDGSESLLIDNQGNFVDNGYPFSGDSYTFSRGNTGYIGEYDFNISGNINNRVYLGMTIGIHAVHYHGYSIYDEVLQGNTYNLNTATLEDYRDITGTGVDVKLGIIFRPVATSPFRIGAYVNSPIFYSLESSNETSLLLNDQRYGNENPRYGSLEYEFRTPWKFGLSVGHTIGNYLALGANYEFADYGATDARIKGDSGYDYWGDYYSNSYADNDMNAHIKQTLKGVSTLKVGAEFKPDKNIAVRLGYNYLSPMYQQDASRGVDVESLGNYYSSNTDYTNWKETHRVTAGIGFTM